MARLPKRRLGRTGVDVTALGFGAMELRGRPSGPEISDRQAEELLHAVLDAGIDFIDTSIDYGRSEELIGRFLSHRRDEYFLASKCGCVIGADISRGPAEHIHTAKNVRTGVENSLRLLKTERLDLVQFHRSLEPREFSAEGALQELQELQHEGKVRFLGVSGTLPNLHQQIGMGVFDAFQIPYSALQREHEAVIAEAAAAGAGTIIRGGVARGAPEDWDGRPYYMMAPDELRGRWDRARLDELRGGMSRVEFMLRFTLSHPDLSTAIVGTRSPEHLADNVAAALAGPLPADVTEEAKRRLAEAGSKPP